MKNVRYRTIRYGAFGVIARSDDGKHLFAGRGWTKEDAYRQMVRQETIYNRLLKYRQKNTK